MTLINKREPISKKLRFEIFKRDSFKCQYCGRSSPDIVLEIDHIKPVKKNGKTTIENLITSCFDCNRGKGAKKLDDKSEIEKAKKQLDLLNERRLQLEMMLKWREGLDCINDLKIKNICDYWSKDIGYSLNDNGIKSLKNLINKFELNDLFSAIKIAKDKYIKYDKKGKPEYESIENAWSKVGGILYLNSKPEKFKKIAYIKGICRNRFNYFDEKKASIMLNKYFDIFEDYDDCIDYAKSCANWYQWYNGMLNFINDN